MLVTGPRQAGKTTFLTRQMEGAHGYVSFDDPLERAFALQDPQGFLDRFETQPLVLDEFQYVPDILPYLKMRIDRDPSQTGRFLLTGPQQFQLMRTVTESLAGRIAILELLPFGRREYPGALPLDLAA